MKQKKVIRKTFEMNGSDWPPLDAYGFIDWFQSKISAVPDESRDSLAIAIDAISSYDTGYATIEFIYDRIETDEEESDREREALLRESRIREQELSELARLQAKYGNLADKS